MKTNVMMRDTHNVHAYNGLKFAFVVAPIIAGLDKFFNILTDWTQYLAPVFYELLNITPSTFMMAVGVIEIVAGIGVLLKPKVFAYVVSAWLLAIIVNLLFTGQYYDIALRDLGLAIGAYCLGEMSRTEERVGDVDVDTKTERPINQQKLRYS